MSNAERIVRALDQRLDHEVHDPQDMEDVSFLLRHDRVTPHQIEAAIAEAIIPDLEELREAFERAKPRVRELARQTTTS